MFSELDKYEQNDHFFLRPEDNLAKVCNAPADKSGVYIVYALKGGRIELIYIGRSGKLNKDGSMFIRKAGLGGMKDRIVNGHQFGKTPRRISWIMQLQLEKIEALDIYWYATHNEKYTDNPVVVERTLLDIHCEVYGQLPKWNKM